MAHPLSEARQACTDHRAALRALETQRDTARATINGILSRQSAATAAPTVEETAALAAAEQAAESLGARISASRKLLTNIEAAESELQAQSDLDKLGAGLKGSATRIEVSDNTAVKPWASFGEHLKAAHRAAQKGAIPDPRLYAVLPSGMGETIGPDGGFMVGGETSTRLLERAYDVGNILSRVNRIPITNGNSIKIPALDETSRADGSRMGGVSAYWVEEAGQKTGTKPRFRQITLTLHKLAMLVRVTDELLEDAPALESFIMARLPDEITFRLEDAIVNGDGAGKPLGWMNSGAVVTVAKEGAQANTTFTFKNALKMWSRMWAPSRKNAIWLLNQDVEPELYSMSLAVGTGGSAVFMPAGGASEQPFATLFGRPLIPAEYAQTLGVAGDVQLVDPTQYLFADKGGVQKAQSMHFYFDTDEQAFRFVVRVDGQPEWNSPLTPKNGTNTLSPFVTLAGRP